MATKLTAVFLHGFMSSKEVWRPTVDSISVDADVAHVEPHLFSYASPFVSRIARQIPDLSLIADRLATVLNEDLRDRDALMLVGHSQGGLIIHRFLARQLALGRGEQLTRVRRIVTFATPNAGAEIALLIRRWAKFWRNPQERELRPLHPVVSETVAAVVDRVVYAERVAPDRCPIPIVAYAAETDGVVTAASARAVFPDTGVLPGDHFSIIQPDGPDHPFYQTLRRHLLLASETRAPMPRRQPSPPAVPSLSPPQPAVPAQQMRHDPAPTAPRRLTGTDVASIVHHLRDIPGMADPDFRTNLVQLLPAPVQLQRLYTGVAQRDLVGLVQALERFPHQDPWVELLGGLAALVPPTEPALSRLASLLLNFELVTRPQLHALGIPLGDPA